MFSGTRVLPWLAVVLLGACGGSTKSTAPGANAGASHSVGGASGGADFAGSASGGADFAGSASGGADFAGSASGGAAAGAGGKVPDFPGGAPNNSLSCSAPYAGPSGGPRADGPVDLGGCAGIPDEVVLARYKDNAARVPQGLYFEPSERIAFWNDPCSGSEEETVKRGPPDGMGTFVKSYSNDWFYEAVYCFDNSVRRVERNLRCDYFDGTKLATPTPENLAFLASMLWWGGHSNLEGAAILGHAITIGDATDVIEVCTIDTAYGDFGLCDEVRLESTKHRLMFDGTVKLGTPEEVRTLKGDCH